MTITDEGTHRKGEKFSQCWFRRDEIGFSSLVNRHCDPFYGTDLLRDVRLFTAGVISIRDLCRHTFHESPRHRRAADLVFESSMQLRRPRPTYSV